MPLRQFSSCNAGAIHRGHVAPTPQPPRKLIATVPLVDSNVARLLPHPNTYSAYRLGAVMIGNAALRVLCIGLFALCIGFSPSAHAQKGPGDDIKFDASWAKGDTKNVIATSAASPNFALGVSPHGVPDRYFFELAGGISTSQTNSTGNFFGPGTGGGLLLTNDGWSSPSLVISGGIYGLFSPSWYGGININLTTPALNGQSSSGITGNGIPVSFEQSGIGVDVMGRFGYKPLEFPVRFFGEVGFNVTNYQSAIVAPSVGDFFTRSHAVASPIIGGGFDISLCPPLPQPPQGFCPFVELEATHTFTNQSWLIQTTPLSSGDVSQRGTTRISLKLGVDVPSNLQIFVPVRLPPRPQ